VWVSTLHPARNYTTADLQQLLIDAGGLNASKLYRILQANSTSQPVSPLAFVVFTSSSMGIILQTG
jgi:hypothetical protein